MSWNFFATSHGKGAVDGVGATLKSLAWRNIKSESVSITDALSFVTNIQRLSKVKIIYIPVKRIQEFKSFLDMFWSDVDLLPNTQKCHAFVVHNDFIVCKTVSSDDDGCVYNLQLASTQSIMKDVREMAKYNIGDIVIVLYNKQHYPGKVVRKFVYGMEVSCMESIGRNKWIWPAHDNIMLYRINDIQLLNESSLVGIGTSKRISHYEILE